MFRSRPIRQGIWDRLRDVALPDARFHHDYAHFIPDFIGADLATQRLLDNLPAADAGILFVAPDNSLLHLRAALIAQGRPFILASYNLVRGFLLIDPAQLPAAPAQDLALLDLLDRYGHPLTLEELSELGPIAALITGLSAVAINGIRFGKGHGFLEMEWAIFSTLGLVQEATALLSLAHDCQILPEALNPAQNELTLDIIATPTQILRPLRESPRPRAVDWSKYSPRDIAEIPPLRALARVMGIA